MKRVKCIDTSEIFTSITHASKKHNISVSSISNCLHGVNKTAGGMRWVLLDEENASVIYDNIKWWRNTGGYYAHVKNGITMLLHRYVYIKESGKHIKENNIIHHIDFDKENNDISNLVEMTPKEHSYLHANDEAKKEKISKLHKGKVLSKETKDKLSVFNTKYKNGEVYFKNGRYQKKINNKIVRATKDEYIKYRSLNNVK